MKTTATLRYLRIAPRKVRLVAKVVEGLSVSDAEAQLRFMRNRAALPLAKLLHSAAENAKRVSNIPKEKMRIARIHISDGPRMKRVLPKAFGRASRIMKRSSHAIVHLQTH